MSTSARFLYSPAFRLPNFTLGERTGKHFGIGYPTSQCAAFEDHRRACVCFQFAGLIVAEGAGAASRRSLGTAVFGGMVVSTILNLYIVPTLYVLVKRMREGKGKSKSRRPFVISDMDRAEPESLVDTASHDRL
jgi:hypothetical protein